MIPELLIPASELRNRIANKQIRLNDDPIDLQTYRILNLESAVDLGEWLFQNYASRDETIDILLRMYEPEVWADNNCPKLMEHFRNKAILQISKKQKFIIDYETSNSSTSS
jgi:hypothetical protein